VRERNGARFYRERVSNKQDHPLGKLLLADLRGLEL